MVSFNIAFVTDIFTRAGAQRVMASLANSLVEKGLRVGIYCLDRSGEAESWLSDSVGVYPIGRRVNKVLDWKCVSTLRSLLQEHGVDIVQSHNWSTLLECSAATIASRRVRHIHAEHGGLIFQPGASKLKNLGRIWLARLALERADRRLAIAQRLRSRLSAETRISLARILYIPNGIEMPGGKFANPAEARVVIKSRLGIPTDRFVFGTVARLHEIKRLDWMIGAFAKALQKGLDATLLIVGEGQERGRLESLTRELGVQQHVVLAGEQSDVADWLASMDIYVNSSRSEGMSISILEAMAFGIPILATDVGDSGTLVGGDKPAGILVTPGDLDLLCEGMLSLRMDAQQRSVFGANAHSKYQSQYSLSMMCDRYMELYRSVLSLPAEIVNQRGGGGT